MSKSVKTWFIIALLTMNISTIYGFIHKPPCIYRRMRIKYKLMIKHNDPIIQSKNEIINNIIYIMKDDITNDFLYFMKFYHFTDDTINSYFYIVFYELLSLSIRQDNNKISNLPISMINIIIYIILKNILLNNILHHMIILNY